jgi:dihydroorotate dehydrogenase electron transfer subunit
MAATQTGKQLNAPRGGRSFRARITSNEPVNEQHRLLTFEQPQGTPEPGPGQFYMLGTGGNGIEPLLKRPFCLFRQTDDGVQVLYRIIGKGTRALAQVQPGDILDVVGPLGNTYPAPPRGTTPVVVTGGIGMASVFPFIMAHRGKVEVVYGARTASELMFLDELAGAARTLHICTDDGSHGIKGVVLDALEHMELDEHTRLYVCGPKPMLRAVKELADAKGIAGWASLEEYMACGIGACMGCVCRTKKGYSRVCKEGPIFRLEDLVYEQ